MESSLPESKEAWEQIKEEFILRGIEDTPESWTFIISQLQNTKMPELFFTYESVISHFKRWKIATVLQLEKQVYLTQLQDKLKVAIENLPNEESENGPSSSDEMSIGTLEPEPEVPVL